MDKPVHTTLLPLGAIARLVPGIGVLVRPDHLPPHGFQLLRLRQRLGLQHLQRDPSGKQGLDVLHRRSLLRVLRQFWY